MNQQALEDQMRLCAIKSCEKRSCHMLVVQLGTKQTGRGKCGRIFPAWSLHCTSLKLRLMASVTSIKICQNNSPLLWWMLIQSRAVSVTVCCFGPRRFIHPFFNAAFLRADDKAAPVNAQPCLCHGFHVWDAAQMPDSPRSHMKVTCPPLDLISAVVTGTRFKGPIQTCLQVSCVHQDVGL